MKFNIFLVVIGFSANFRKGIAFEALSKYQRANLIQHAKGFGVGNKDKKAPKSVQKIDDAVDEKLNIIRKSGEPEWQKHAPNLNLSYKGARFIHASPPVLEIDDFFAPELCDEFIARAGDKGHIYQSQTFSQLTAAARTSTTWYYIAPY